MNEVDLRAVKIAGEAKTELQKHLIECSERYHQLNNKVDVQDVKLDAVIESIKEIKNEVTAVSDKIEKKEDEKNTIMMKVMVFLFTGALAIIGFLVKMMFL